VSGFAGIVRSEPSEQRSEADRLTLGKMARAIAFRGPDARQQWQHDGGSFAFSLLRTGPAPQEQAQPCSLDRETWFLGEARLDGREDLIRTLAGEGSELALATGEELVLRFVSRFGEAALPLLDGDFSFVLWNARTKRLIAYRDLTGSRPLFYALGGGKLSFSNTLEALLADPDVARDELDLAFVGDFLLGAPHQDLERTVYRDIRRLPAGYLLEFSPSGFGVRRIARLPVEDLLTFRRGEEAVEEFRRLFDRAVQDRLPAGAAALFLSGGLDSTSIAAAAGRLRSMGALCELRAFHFDLQPIFADEEGTLAARCAEWLGLPLRNFHVGSFLPFDDIEKSALPEPGCSPYWAMHQFCFQQIANEARVVLTGDGGDEILSTPALPYLRYLSSRSHVFRSAGVLLGYLASRRKLPTLGAGIRSRLLRLLGRDEGRPVFPSWLTAEAERRFDLRSRFLEMTARPPSEHPFNPRAYALFNGQSFAQTMEDQDPLWTRVPVETRAPLLDRRLLRFLLRLPPVPWLMKKDVLRQANRGLLPDRIRLRPKVPVPVDPLVLQVASGRWRPELPPARDPLNFFVDWPRLALALGRPPGLELYANLLPLGLALWLESVEKHQAIQ
jgi:asparagine synthase (glutamine-hydrolysing)